MTSFVLLLRGVGGRVQVAPRLLRAVLGAEGFDRVRVIGHTGNAVLDCSLASEEVAARAAGALLREIGFRNDLQVVSGVEWLEIVAGNPFPSATARDGALHVAVMGAEPDPARVAALSTLGDGEDGIVVRGRVAYLHAPHGFRQSRIANRFDRGIGVPSTTRSWAVVLKLHALLDPVPAEAG
ncbi:DUF1697 domain-containing protein [Rubellimicrobium aerolatum]|uniref:DUF1697 domain-containing protein n=1 Tax=Rubellimicrobium aerolatum TaxID=490979 RepID=A0ABW0SG83_9RHOB|nr:DUF1697 domain-containing protein [Rubellimicrobium aerolatum]MBP1807308.1 uncharacterized protein (DUF1697 family) [Rubellimicrobium aerolatum]